VPKTEDLPLRTLEALARGNTDEFAALSRQLDPASNKRVNKLIASSFFLMATRKWTANTDVAEVRSWVAELRSETEVKLGEIDPLSAERLIVSTVTGDTEKMNDIEPNKVIRLESLMLFKLIYDMKMPEDMVQNFLNEAGQMAEEWT
jgi:hypothetical protein